jgi:hypothetical protein
VGTKNFKICTLLGIGSRYVVSYCVDLVHLRTEQFSISTFTTIYGKCNDVQGLLIYNDVNDLFIVYMGARRQSFISIFVETKIK